MLSPATQGSTNRRVTVLARLGIKEDPISKITERKKVDGVAPVLESLPTKCEVLSSNPGIKKNVSL
jgi:hypothetical protein